MPLIRRFKRPLHGLSQRYRGLVETPGVWEAIAWLYGPRAIELPAFQGKFAKLVRLEANGEHWRVNGPELEGLLAKTLRRNPTLPKDLTKILCGIGELSVRSHANVEGAVVRWLERNRRAFRFNQVLGEAAEVNSFNFAKRPDYARDKVAHTLGVVSYAFAQGDLSPELWAVAVNVHDHRLHVHPSTRYGLQFIARIALSIDARALMQWGRSSTKPTDQWAVFEALQDVCHWRASDAPRLGTALLKSGDPLCLMLAAQALIAPPFAAPQPLADVFRLLLQAGVSSEDACWFCAHGIKAIDQRLKELRHHKAQLEQQLDTLVGIPRPHPNQSVETDRLESELSRVTERLTHTEAAAKVSRHDVAAMLRKTTVSKEKWSLILKDLPREAEDRFRLAELVGAGENKARLLNANISDLMTILDSYGHSDPFSERLHIERSEFERLAFGAAQAAVALADFRKKAVGQQAAQLTGGLVAKALDILSEPFIRQRCQDRWQSALGRASCALLFAFVVANTVPELQRKEISRLVKEITKAGLSILSRVSEPFCEREWWFHALSINIIYWMQLESRTSEIELCADNPALPNFTRMMATWSEPAVARKNLPQALAQFQLTARRWPGEAVADSGLSRAVTALDHAMACPGLEAIAEDLLALWPEVIASWGETAEREWRHAAEWLRAAVQGQEPAASELLADPRFKNSRCRAAITQTLAATA